MLFLFRTTSICFFFTPTESAEITSMFKNFEVTFAKKTYIQFIDDLSVYLVVKVNLKEYEPYKMLHPFITLQHNK